MRIFLFIHLFVFISSIYAHAHFTEHSPFFYAVLAEVPYDLGSIKKQGYEKIKSIAQAKLVTLIKNEAPEVVEIIDHKSRRHGSTKIVLMRDFHGDLHVSFEGSNSFRNFVSNTTTIVMGIFTHEDIPQKLLRQMHEYILAPWIEKYGSLTSMVGHSRGGMFASQIADHYRDVYENTHVITFNGFKPKPDLNQTHFLIAKEKVASLWTSERRYTKIDGGLSMFALLDNHRLSSFFIPLQQLNLEHGNNPQAVWDTILIYPNKENWVIKENLVVIVKRKITKEKQVMMNTIDNDNPKFSPLGTCLVVGSICYFAIKLVEIPALLNNPVTAPLYFTH